MANSKTILLQELVFYYFHWGMPIPEDYQLKRLANVQIPITMVRRTGAGWNTIQSLVAIGSGGLTEKVV